MRAGTSTWQDIAGGLGVKAGNVGSVGDAEGRMTLGRGGVVSPGGTAQFSTTLAAPAAPGVGTLQFQMVNELIAWFGERSPVVSVTTLCGVESVEEAVQPPRSPSGGIAGRSAAAASLQQAVDTAIAAGDKSLTVAAGTYAFGVTNFEMNHATSFTLEAADLGAVVLQFYPGFGVLIQNCSATTLRGLIVDYDPPCFTQGRIVAVAPNPSASIDVALDAGFPPPSAPYFASSEIKLQFYAADAARRRVSGQPNFQPARVGAAVAPGIWRFGAPSGLSSSFVPVRGMLVSVSPRLNTSGYYSGNAVSVLGSARCGLSDVTIYGSGNFALVEWGGPGGHTYTRVVIDRPRDHLLSSNCDGFHSFSFGTGGALVDSALSFSGDDVVNFHNREGYVLAAAASPATFVVLDVGDIPAPGGGPPLRAMADLAPGGALSVWRAGAHGVLVARLRVASVAPVTEGATIDAARALCVALWGAGRVNPAAVGAWAITTSGAGRLEAGDVVQFDARASANGTLLRVNASDVYDSCGRLQASGVAYVNSSCARAASGLTVVYDAAFAEGSRGLGGLVIEGNVFRAVGDPPAANMSGVLLTDPDAEVLVADNAVLPE